MCQLMGTGLVLLQITCSSAIVMNLTTHLAIQVENMTNKHHVYMTKDGRISLAGLNKAKSEYLAKAIDDSVRNC